MIIPSFASSCFEFSFHSCFQHRSAFQASVRSAFISTMLKCFFMTLQYGRSVMNCRSQLLLHAGKRSGSTLPTLKKTWRTTASRAVRTKLALYISDESRWRLVKTFTPLLHKLSLFVAEEKFFLRP